MYCTFPANTARIVFITLIILSFFSRASVANAATGTNTDVNQSGTEIESDGASKQPSVAGVVGERVEAEREDAFNPYVITAHKHNYIMPISFTTNVNESAYQLQGAPDDLNYKPYEVNFQVSLKSQVNQNDLLFNGDALYFGLTMESWWQLYNGPLSSPFRETNYQPEIFYTTPLLWGPFGGKTGLTLGLEHQSNGQLQELSRSWNRIYAELIYGRGSFVASFRPWYRIPEKAKTSPTDAEGDDNPDILDYMGYAQLSLGWKNSTYELSTVIRGNTTTGKGAVDATITFPLSGKFRGMVQYFNGYGDSLIDYDRFQQRLGLGVALTNLF